MRIELKNKVIGLVMRSIVIAMAVFFIIPVLLTILKSFGKGGAISFHGYYQLFFNCFPFYRMFWNSVIYAGIITIGTMIICVPAAVSFKFAHFKGKNLLFVIYIIIMMMPLQVMLLPNYIGLRDMGLQNTFKAIMIPMIFSPFGVVVTHQYMREIDCTVIEAARLETHSVIKIIMHCIIPQIKVGIAAIALLVFAEAWNMVEQPMLYVDEDKLRTLSAFIAQADKYEASIMLPASVLFMVPVLICYVLFHEELKQGLRL